jgi:AcrR family transcriptional regulator
MKESSPRRHYRMGRRAEAMAETRARIVEAAREVLSEVPLRRFSVDEAARLAGVNRTTVYDAFGSRTGLLEAVAEDLLRRGGFDRIGQALAEPDVVRAIDGSLDEWARLYEAEAHVAEPIFALAALDPDALRAVEIFERGRWDGMQHLAGRLEEQGRLRPGVTRQEAAELLWIVTNIQTFGQLTRQRGLPPARAAERLKALVPAVRDEVTPN